MSETATDKVIGTSIGQLKEIKTALEVEHKHLGLGENDDELWDALDAVTFDIGMVISRLERFYLNPNRK